MCVPLFRYFYLNKEAKSQYNNRFEYVSRKGEGEERRTQNLSIATSWRKITRVLTIVLFHMKPILERKICRGWGGLLKD